MQEASYVTARLAQTMARVDSRDAAEPWREQYALTICSKVGVKVGLTPAPARFKFGGRDGVHSPSLGMKRNQTDYI